MRYLIVDYIASVYRYMRSDRATTACGLPYSEADNIVNSKPRAGRRTLCKRCLKNIDKVFVDLL